MAFRPGGFLLPALFTGTMVSSQYKDYRNQGQSIPQAASHATVVGVAIANMGIAGSVAYPLVSRLPGMLIQSLRNGPVRARQASMPFSQRYENSDVANRLQSYSLSRMSEMQGFGNEAGQMYGRYMR